MTALGVYGSEMVSEGVIKNFHMPNTILGTGTGLTWSHGAYLLVRESENKQAKEQTRDKQENQIALWS